MSTQAYFTAHFYYFCCILGGDKSLKGKLHSLGRGSLHDSLHNSVAATGMLTAPIRLQQSYGCNLDTVCIFFLLWTCSLNSSSCDFSGFEGTRDFSGFIIQKPATLPTADQSVLQTRLDWLMLLISRIALTTGISPLAALIICTPVRTTAY